MENGEVTQIKQDNIKMIKLLERIFIYYYYLAKVLDLQTWSDDYCEKCLSLDR